MSKEKSTVAVKSAKKAKTMPKIVKKVNVMETILADMDKVVSDLNANRGKKEEKITEISKLREKISELNGKNEAWNYYDKMVGDFKAMRRYTKVEEGRRVPVNSLFLIPEVKDYTEIFLSAMIKHLRRERNKVVSK